MIKPILIPADESNILKSGFNNLWITPPMKVKSSDVYVDVILVDTEAEIVKEDWVYDKHEKPDEIYQIISKPALDTINRFKIISSTSKSNNLPLLSPQSIQLLINYYNEYKCMPESVIVSNKGFSEEIRDNIEFYMDIIK